MDKSVRAVAQRSQRSKVRPRKIGAHAARSWPSTLMITSTAASGRLASAAQPWIEWRANPSTRPSSMR
jgi:hypothetical protein